MSASSTMRWFDMCFTITSSIQPPESAWMMSSTDTIPYSLPPSAIGIPLILLRRIRSCARRIVSRRDSTTTSVRITSRILMR